MESIVNIKGFMGVNADGYQIDIGDFQQIGSISQDTNQYDNYGITIYRTNKGIVMYENTINDSEYYLLDPEEAKEAQDNSDDFLKFHAELWAENADGYDQQRLEMIAWGLRDAGHYAVPDDYAGECKIIVRKYFYGPYHPLSYLCEDWSYEPIVFTSKAAAQEKINEMDNETYYLSHNESGRPGYTIVEA